MSELPALDAMDNPTVQGRRPGALEWVALFALVVHGTQAAYNILRGPKGSATMYVSLADVLLGVAFLLWILRRIARRDFSWPLHGWPCRWGRCSGGQRGSACPAGTRRSQGSRKSCNSANTSSLRIWFLPKRFAPSAYGGGRFPSWLSPQLWLLERP